MTYLLDWVNIGLLEVKKIAIKSMKSLDSFRIIQKELLRKVLMNFQLLSEDFYVGLNLLLILVLKISEIVANKKLQPPRQEKKRCKLKKNVKLVVNNILRINLLNTKLKKRQLYKLAQMLGKKLTQMSIVLNLMKKITYKNSTRSSFLLIFLMKSRKMLTMILI